MRLGPERNIAAWPQSFLSDGHSNINSSIWAITLVAAARKWQDPAAAQDTGRETSTIKEPFEWFDKEHNAFRVKASTGT